LRWKVIQRAMAARARRAQAKDKVPLIAKKAVSGAPAGGTEMELVIQL